MKSLIIKTVALLLLVSCFSVLQAQTVKDVDGNIYKTVTIGIQTWMAENLRTTKLNNGSAVPSVTDNGSWYDTSEPGYCWYDNDEETYKVTYGGLYNWYAINTGRLCPEGWHIPDDSEWKNLAASLGGDSVAGGRMKETGSLHWSAINAGATNMSGFTALPGGYRHPKGEEFSGIGDFGYWWSNNADSTGPHNWVISYSGSNLDMSRCSETLGISVRCVKLTAKLPSVSILL